VSPKQPARPAQPKRLVQPKRSGILAGPVGGAERIAAVYPALPVGPGVRLVHRASGFAGTFVRFAGGQVVVRGDLGLERDFGNDPGTFSVDGIAVRLVAADGAVSTASASGGTVSATERTASGSRAVVGAKARVARASRILVEGVHDAELVEKVWGDDLRLEGVVVERLDGIDHLPDVIRAFAPAKGRRLGVLVDHLVPGSKEARLAAEGRHPHVAVTGTPYIDVWEAVKPSVVGIERWPTIERGRNWKDGICEELGVGNPGAFWRRILASVTSWRDLEQPLVRSVEQLIDFVTEPG
jgi:Protein of unknown function (DUF3097)